MHNYKIKDIIVIVISAIIFVGALVFIFEGGGESKQDKSKPSSEELIEQPEFISKYNEDIYKELADFTDYSVLDPSGLCKGDLFSQEDPMQPGSICYALQELGLLSDINNTNNADNEAEVTLRNNERKEIIENAKDAIDSYKQKNNDYPDNANSYQLSVLLKEGGILNSFLTSDSKKEDPSGDNTRLCYAKRSSTQYWLYYVPEPTEAPGSCLSDDPKGIEGAVDFSVR